MRNLKRRSVITTTMDDDVDGKTQFSDLPSCLVIDILSRLSVTTLMSCRCVCRDWTRLFRDPNFIKLQLAASPLHILKLYLMKDGIFQFLQIMEEEDECTGDPEVKIVNLYTKANLPNSTKKHVYPFINSCNGLLCLMEGDSYFNRSARSVWVCNPILGEWVSISTPVRNYLPPPRSETGVASMFSAKNYLPPRSETETGVALVFSAKNNQYKLLHGFETEEKESKFEIYTLGGTRKWRSIDETLGCRPWNGLVCFQGFSAFLHGSLHWTNGRQDFICCFDVDSEKFRRLSLPISEIESTIYSMLRLRVVNGRLCVVLFAWTDVKIWAMKEYGVEESWVMMLTFPVCIGDDAISLESPLLLFSRNEEEIIIYDLNEGLFSYNLKRNMLRRCSRSQGKKVDSIYGVAYKPSIVSLHDVAKGEEVMLSRTMQVIQ